MQVPNGTLSIVFKSTCVSWLFEDLFRRMQLNTRVPDTQ